MIALQQRRGQYTFEFVMTYGWVLIVALVVMAALVYFDVFDLHGILPDSCLLGPGLTCVDPLYQIGEVTSGFGIGVIGLSVINNLGKDLIDFFVVVDPDHPQCGGWTGIINSRGIAEAAQAAGVNPEDIDKFHNGTKAFLHGEKRKVIMMSFEGWVYQPPGFIVCAAVTLVNTSSSSDPLVTPYSNYPPEYSSCCDSKLSKTYYYPPNGLCPGKKVAETTCLFGANMINVKRLRTDLWVFYREKGSKILHKRIGKWDVAESGSVFVNCPTCVGPS